MVLPWSLGSTFSTQGAWPGATGSSWPFPWRFWAFSTPSSPWPPSYPFCFPPAFGKGGRYGRSPGPAWPIPPPWPTGRNGFGRRPARWRSLLPPSLWAFLPSTWSSWPWPWARGRGFLPGKQAPSGPFPAPGAPQSPKPPRKGRSQPKHPGLHLGKPRRPRIPQRPSGARKGRNQARASPPQPPRREGNRSPAPRDLPPGVPPRPRGREPRHRAGGKESQKPPRRSQVRNRASLRKQAPPPQVPQDPPQPWRLPPPCPSHSPPVPGRSSSGPAGKERAGTYPPPGGREALQRRCAGEWRSTWIALPSPLRPRSF